MIVPKWRPLSRATPFLSMNRGMKWVYSIRNWVGLLLLLAPAAAFQWSNQDLPRFGELHDESLYFVSAKSLADGGGYRIESLPGEPAQTKYPPLYPLLLSVVWRLNPVFPQNLVLAGWLSWLALPAILILLLRMYPDLGFSRFQTWLMLAMFALGPYIILTSTLLLSELPFLVLILAAMLLIEGGLKRPANAIAWIASAGVVTGLAYLTRSAGIALVPAAILYFWIRKQPRLGAIFVATSVPLIAGWMVWARVHQTPTDDPALFYYLDYLRYQLYSVSLAEFPLFLWKNTDGLLWGLGGLIVPKIASSMFLKIFSQVLAVAMISGVVRMLRKGQATLFALFALFSCGMLLVWHYPPNERFVIPIFPLALAGLVTELTSFTDTLRVSFRHRKKDQRVAAYVLGSFAALIVVAVVGLQVYLAAFYLPEDARQHRVHKADRVAEFKWIQANTPAYATVLSADDPLLYLYTGRHAMRKTLPTSFWYHQDRPGMVNWLAQVEPFAVQHKLMFFDFAGVESTEGLEDEDRDKIGAEVRTNPLLTPMFQQGESTFYKVMPGSAANSGPNSSSLIAGQAQ
jgi:hypothetical protein